MPDTTNGSVSGGRRSLGKYVSIGLATTVLIAYFTLLITIGFLVSLLTIELSTTSDNIVMYNETSFNDLSTLSTPAITTNQVSTTKTTKTTTKEKDICDLTPVSLPESSNIIRYTLTSLTEYTKDNVSDFMAFLEIDIEIVNPTDKFYLHSNNLSDFAMSIYKDDKLVESSIVQCRDYLVLKTDLTQSIGNYSIYIKYNAQISNFGINTILNDELVCLLIHFLLY
jgi:hypothetical protein